MKLFLTLKTPKAANLQEGRLSDSQPSFIFLSGPIAARCQEVQLKQGVLVSALVGVFIRQGHVLTSFICKHLPKPSLFLVHTESGKVWHHRKLAGAALAQSRVAFLNF